MFYHNWDEINSLPDEAFNSLPFLEVISDASSWDLPRNCTAIVRGYNRKKGKLKEYACKTVSSAHKRIQQLTDRGDDVTVLTHEAIAVLNYDPESEST